MPALEIENSDAGLAFMEMRTVVSTTAAGSRLFLPLLDGTARVGVLEIETAGTAVAEQ